jgi:aminoglycoside 3-N-acetyltransferase
VLEDEDDFERLGAAFEAEGPTSIGPVGNATGRLMSQRAVVDFATDWIAANRTVTG